uniref:C40 family peptidase n=1 Tax=Alistipes sp. TaxID=1872444 RepID=UPI0040565E45
MLLRLLIPLFLLLVPLRAFGDEWPRERATSRVDSLLRDARSLLGARYRYGAMGNGAFDCSGFTAHLFGRYGYHLGRSARAQAQQGELVGRDSLRVGDLVVFTGRRINKSRAGHIGIVVEVDSTGDFRFIHACHRGVIESRFSEERYYRERYIGARRIFSPDDHLFPVERPPLAAVLIAPCWEQLSPPMPCGEELRRIEIRYPSRRAHRGLR